MAALDREQSRQIGFMLNHLKQGKHLAKGMLGESCFAQRYAILVCRRARRRRIEGHTVPLMRDNSELLG